MIKTFRDEQKYLISTVESTQLRADLEAVLHSDKHNGTDGYIVRSLYFDSVDDTDYSKKIDGIGERRKIRIRTYDPAKDVALLEMKQKCGEQRTKRSLVISRDVATTIIRGDYSALLGLNNAFADECYAIMTTQAYLPKAIVEYRRFAYLTIDNRARITFDDRVKSTESSFDLFSLELPLYPVVDEFLTILEVKYTDFLVSYVGDMINRVNKSRLAISKYCLSRSVSMKYIN